MSEYYHEITPGNRVLVELTSGKTVPGDLLSITAAGVQLIHADGEAVTAFYPHHAVQRVVKPTRKPKKVKRPEPYFD